MQLVEGILATAGALGISPLDLATAVSYETAGTFDATKRGPTTQWGQHRGLIQFGEPQARKYGVDWNDPIGSQLGADGAVAKYLRDTGVKPGMGLLDIYSAINAGGVGRYNASDANNGGAPGTVRDKVEKQMAGHRRNAEQLLTGGAGGDVLIGGQGEDMTEQKKGLSAFLTPDRRDHLISALEGMTLNPNQAMIAAAQGRISQRAQDGRQDGQRNRTAEWIKGQGRPDLAAAVESGAIPANTALQMMKPQDQVKGTEINGQLVNPVTGEVMGDYRDQDAEKTGFIVTGKTAEAYGLDPNNSYNVTIEGDSVRASQIGGNGTSVTVNTGDDLSPAWEAIDKKYAEDFLKWQSGGGADAVKQIAQLTSVLERLEGGEPLTGPFLGLQPDVVQTLFNPDAIDARQKVEEVVQRNLRIVLGAQFTEREGERLIARAYDSRLAPEKNAARLKALVGQMQAAADAKNAMAAYLQKNGTLRGFDGSQYTPSFADFHAVFDQMDRADGVKSAPEGGTVIKLDSGEYTVREVK